jgi:ribonucleotide reductase alpha subunit
MTGEAERPLYEIRPRNRFRLDAEFLRQYEGRQPDWGPVGLVVYKRTYAREKVDGVLEEFWETAQRVVEGTWSIIKQYVSQIGNPWDEEEAQEKAQEMFRRLWAFKWLPPGRGLWFMGTRALELRGATALQNCGLISTQSIDRDFADPFITMMDFLMLGVGVGTDVRGAGKVTIRKPRVGADVFVVEDSREGWCALVRRVLNAYVRKGTLPASVDYSQVRPRGTPLKTFGGTASGPDPLIDLVTSLQRLLDDCIGDVLTVTNITDIMNYIGRCVVAGNIRRSSELILGNPDDEEFLALKDPTELNWLRHELEGWKKRPPGHDAAAIEAEIARIEAEIANHPLMTHRWAANLSIDASHVKDFAPYAARTVANGEPGYIFLDNARKHGRMCDPPDDRDQHTLGFNPCVPPETRVLTRQGYFKIIDLVGKEIEVWNGRAWDSTCPRLTATNQSLSRVHLSDGTHLDCTDYHQWCLVDEVLETRDLTPGDVLAKWQMPVIEYGEDWDLAYTHGFFCGDGQDNGHSRGALLYGVKKELVPYLATRSVSPPDAYDRIYVGFSQLPDKFEIPWTASVKSRLDWVAGLLDADGTVLQNPNSVCLQLASVRPDFLREVRLLLTTLGVQAKVTPEREAGLHRLPDGHGGQADYSCQACWRLLINAADTYHLVKLGLSTHRCVIPALKPQRDARRFVTVERIEILPPAPEVYCFTTESHRGTFEGIVTRQCVEQPLEDGELCCLVETNPCAHENLEDYLVTLKYAYLYAKVVTLIPTHRQKTNAVMTRNRRIGTSMFGIWHAYEKLGMQELIRWCQSGYDTIRRWDKTYSHWLGVNESIRVTTVKPGGSVPLLTHEEGGMRVPNFEYGFRTVRMEESSPIVEACRRANYRVEKDLTTPYTAVVYFPMSNPGLRTVEQVSLWEQASLLVMLQRYWSDNGVSCTLLFKPDEARDIPRVLQAYADQIKAASFLPASNHGYAQAPYIPLTKEEHDVYAAQLLPLDLSGSAHEADPDKFCSGGTCEIKH